MSRHVAVVRDAAGLDRAAASIAAIAGQLGSDSASGELRGMALLATAIVAAARHREESRGSHYRADFAQIDPALDGMHQLLTADTAGHCLRYGTPGDVVGRHLRGVT